MKSTSCSVDSSATTPKSCRPERASSTSCAPALTAQAEELGASRHMDFPGFVENPYAFMAKASLFVLSSRHEGLGNVLIQAMACGCPVVSTDCPHGPAEILEDGRWGELVPVGDSRTLSEAMIRALDLPPPREAIRERASAFGVDQAVTRYEELLMPVRRADLDGSDRICSVGRSSRTRAGEEERQRA